MKDGSNQIEFPCEALPEDAGDARLIGLYPQRQKGRWMQRIKILGGRLTGEQWKAVGQIAEQFTPDTPLHLTTRQELEFHNLTDKQIPLVQEAMAAVGLGAIGACGDTLRNVIACQCPGVTGNKVGLYDLAWDVRRTLETMEGIYSLPRKFKISFSSCSSMCAQPWINDLGFIACQNSDDEWGLRVLAGGSLGAKPGTGMELFEWLDASDVVPLVVAVVRFFAANGDRTNRRKARLRHVRERMGNDAFSAALKSELTAVKAEREWKPVQITEDLGSCGAVRVLTFANGDISPAAAGALGALAEDQRYQLRIGNHHRVYLFGLDEASLLEILRQHSALDEAAKLRASVVACPGKRWCSRAIVHTNVIADRIREQFAAELLPTQTVCISGCPNGCAHSRVADIGLTGRMVTQDGEKVEGFTLYAGGGMGRSDKLAEQIADKLTADQVIDQIRKLISDGI